MAETVRSPPGLLRGPAAGGNRGGTLRILRRICSPVETPVPHRQVRLFATCSGRRLLSVPGDRRDPPENPHLEGERTLGRRDRPTAFRRGGGHLRPDGGEGPFGRGVPQASPPHPPEDRAHRQGGGGSAAIGGRLHCTDGGATFYLRIRGGLSFRPVSGKVSGVGTDPFCRFAGEQDHSGGQLFSVLSGPEAHRHGAVRPHGRPCLRSRPGSVCRSECPSQVYGHVHLFLFPRRGSHSEAPAGFCKESCPSGSV